MKVNNWGGVITLSDNVHSRLILMHGVQNNLFKETQNITAYKSNEGFLRKLEKNTKSLKMLGIGMQI